MSRTGSGTTIAPIGISLVGRVQKIGGWDQSVAVLDDTSLLSTDFEEYVLGEIVKHGAITVDMLVDNDESLPALGDVRSWSIVTANAWELTGTAGISRVLKSEEAVNQRRRYVFELQFDGKTGPTLSS